MSQNRFQLPRTQPFVAVAIVITCCTTAIAQQRTVHNLYNINMPPGAIGAQQVRSNIQFRGYVQPVKVRAPDGAVVSIGCDQAFQYPSPALQVGLLVGQVYRLKVENIPRFEDEVIYPSLEIINRLYPPKGLKARFPVQVELAQEDLEDAIAGKMVVRVIYVEDPNQAFPQSEDPDHQRYFDVLPEEDPLHVADELGRPIAILRLGSRRPNYTGPDDEFLFGSPPVSVMPEDSDPVIVSEEIVDAEPVETTPDELSPDAQELPPAPIDGVTPPAGLDSDVDAAEIDAIPSPSDQPLPGDANTELDDPFVDDLED